MGADRGGQRMGTGLLATVRLLPTVSRVGTAALVLLAAASAALPVALVVASGRLVGAAPAVIGGGIDSPAGSALLWAVAVVAGLYLAEQVVGEATGIFARDMARRLDGHLRVQAVAGSLRPTGIAHLEEPETASAVSLARNLAPGMLSPGSAVAGLAEAVPPRLSVLGSAVVVATFSLPLAGTLLVGWAAGSLVVLRYFLANAAAFTGQRTDLYRSVYFRDLALTPPAAKETRVFGLAGWIGERFGAVWEEAVTPSRQQRRQGCGRLVAVFAGFGIGTAVGLAVVGLAGLGGDLSLERVVILVGAVRQTLNLHFRGSELSVAYGAAALAPLLALERRTRLDPAAAGRSLPAADLPARVLRFESVDFAYPGASCGVFAGLDLEIPAGQRLAIVGTNGAGKTTLVKLLAGLYSPDRGRITIDGVDLADLDPTAWRAQVAVLFQDYVRFEASAAENVGFGAVRLGFDAAALDRAAQRAGAGEVVAHLERGWETILSRSVEGGTDLSAGQWQRVALARALFAVDAGARVLVLDEPTANLDVRAEAAVYARLLEVTSRMAGGAPVTIIVISHRFSTVRRADRIVVLEDGRVVEDGTHDTLLAAAGRYARMFSLQAARFQLGAPPPGGADRA